MDLLLRLSIIYFGYLYPAYKCFLAIAASKTNFEQLQMWCRYWVIIAIYTSLERVADVLLSWIPFYGESKLVFIAYLWHADMEGTKHIYETYINPFFTHSQPFEWDNVRSQLTEIFRFLSSKLVFVIEMKLTEVIQQFNLTSLKVPFYRPATAQSQPFQNTKPTSTLDLQPYSDRNSKGSQQLSEGLNDKKKKSDIELLHSSNIPTSASHADDSTSKKHIFRWRRPHH